MGGHPVRPHIINALEAKFVGKRVTTEALIKATNLERIQITHAMAKLAKDEGSGLTQVSRGVWDYKVRIPGQRTEAAEDTIFEKIGVDQHNNPLVRGEETGRIYKITAV